MTERHKLSWAEIQAFQDDQIASTMNYVQAYGRVAQLSLLGNNLSFICEPDVIQALLIKHRERLSRDPFTHRIFKRMLGSGVFIAEGESWRKQRKLIQPIFHAVHIFDFIETFEEMARKMVNRWPTVSEINLEAEMMGLTLSIICKTMFGAEIEAQIPRIGQLMDTMLQAAEFQLQPPLPDWVPTPGHWRQRQAVNELRSLILEIIRERQAEMAAGIAIKPDLLHMLLSARDENGEGLSEVEILEECLTVFVAGHETTAVALSWLIALLLKKPSVLARLKKELSENLDDRPLTVEALKQVPYLKQVIKESLRLHSPAQGFGRRPLETIEVDGYRFEKGETLIFSIYALHRLSEYYPDPLMFDPERFAPDQEPPPRYAYIPFGAGSRTCIGNAFAMLEMQVIMATVLRAVDLVALSDYSFETKLKVTLRPRDEIRLRAVEIPVKKSTSERLTPQEGVTPAQAGMTPSYPRNC